MNRRDQVREILSAYADPEADALELDSLSVVQLAEELEEAFGFVARADDMGPENFGSVDALVAWVEGRARAEGAR